MKIEFETWFDETALPEIFSDIEKFTGDVLNTTAKDLVSKSGFRSGRLKKSINWGLNSASSTAFLEFNWYGLYHFSSKDIYVWSVLYENMEKKHTLVNKAIAKIVRKVKGKLK